MLRGRDDDQRIVHELQRFQMRLTWGLPHYRHVDFVLRDELYHGGLVGRFDTHIDVGETLVKRAQ